MSYTRRVDALCMPHDFKPPKFPQFDGKGNPKQHVTHFIETCNNTGTDGNFMIKQLVGTLKGMVFISIPQNRSPLIVGNRWNKNFLAGSTASCAASA